MLIRMLFLAVLVTSAMALWRVMRPHPLKRIPMGWRLLGATSPMMAEALRIRASMVRVLLRGHGAGTSGLVGDVDRLIETIARAVELQNEARTLASDAETLAKSSAQVRGALDQLGKAHHHLLDTARAEIDGAIDDIRGQLSDQTDFLRMTVAAQREVDRMLVDADSTKSTQPPAAPASPDGPPEDTPS